MMREQVFISVSVLLSFLATFTTGIHGTDQPPSLSPSTPVPLHISSTAGSSYLTTASHLNTSEVESSTAAELSANDTVRQGGNDTSDSFLTHSTVAPVSATAVPGTTVDAAVNVSSVSGNFTDGQEGYDLSVGDNRTLTTTIAPTVPAQTPQTEHQSSTSATTTFSLSSPASASLPQSTTANNRPTTTTSEASTVQTKHKSSTTTTHTSSPTTTIHQSTEASKPHSSTPVQAKARAETPSELNVGDNDSSTSLDPLLAGLVSVFVVTAAVVSLLIFLKFRRRNERPEFRRLQDLPMDDMMEDTPLSMYSY